MAIPTMATYDQYEKMQEKAIDQMRKTQAECITCPTCSSQWFEEVTFQRYQLNHNVIHSQNIPQEPNTAGYKLLKCVHCRDLLEPRILQNIRNPVGDRYDNFLDTLEGKLDTRKEEKKDEIQAEKL
jgi:hypothetical protein